MRRIMMSRILSVALLGGALAAPVTRAQAGGSGAVAAALAGAYSARATGPEAALWNPAVLALPHQPSFALILGGVTGHAATNGVNVGLYNKVSGAFLDDGLKHDVLAAIPADGLRLDAEGEGQALGISVGAFAITSHATGFGSAAVPRDLADLALNGNQLDRTYSFTGTEGNALGYGGVVVAAAIKLPAGKTLNAFTAGAAVEDILVAKHAMVMDATGSIATSSTSFTGSGLINARVGETGSGYAATFGLAAETHGGMRLGLSVSGLGRVHFTKGTDYHNTVSARTVGLDNATGSDLVMSHSDSTAAPAYDVSLPATVHAGLARRVGPIAASADVAYIVRASAGVRTGSDVAVGGELWPESFFRVRGGIGHSGSMGTRVTGGVGLSPGPMRLDIAAVHYGGTSSASTRGVGAGVSFGFEF